MSKYTTGELAKYCGVSVRTVQYYDSRNILVPSDFSDGGRRLYSEEDLRKMQIICFLRDMGFSIDNIGTILGDDNSEKVMAMLIDGQERLLTEEISDRQKKLDSLTEVKRILKDFHSFSVESLGDIVRVMKNRKKRRRVLGFMLATGVLMDLIDIGTLVYGIKTGNFIPFVIGLPFVIGIGVFISRYYWHHVDFICPDCHAVFHPKLAMGFWASHTPNTRRLKCPECGKTSFCVEIYRESE